MTNKMPVPLAALLTLLASGAALASSQLPSHPKPPQAAHAAARGHQCL